MIELKPCPFCGGEAKLKTARKSDGQISYDSIYVACLNCRSTGLSYTTYYNVSSNPEEEAIAAWNRRAEPENKPLTLDELRQMDGEPVWVMHQDGSGARWGIVQDTEYGLCAVVDDDTAYWFTDVCGTIAYRSKPERSKG